MKYLRLLALTLNKHRAWLSTLAVFIVLGLEYGLIIRPSNLAMIKLVEECGQIKTQIASNEISNRSAEDSGEKIKQANDTIGRLEKSLIEKNREIEFVTHLERLANDSRIVQEPSLGPLRSDKNKLYQTATLDINAQGKYQDLMRYLSALENLSYASSISSLSLNRHNEGDGQASMHLIINTYWK